MRNIKKRKKGFTLIELIIVIAILGILAVITVPKLTGIQTNAKKKADMANAKLIADAAAMVLANEDTFNADAIKEKLQGVPKPQYKTGVFCVAKDTNDKIVIYVKEGSSSNTKYYEVYPDSDSYLGQSGGLSNVSSTEITLD
ncbi:type II secretion system protein G precursor [Clostridium tepidiprofundi DSM 19306]|uniref:Type II secretion system protein G n=1 Tax=Clostridium tepidiprofundi DSM 19306 TaxID=1121338 RepID=A0A151B5X3_9CLOT|nr:prepilin-type N-terminal cleavage/methylation domain-containing protein [Clostridium tepidiprofundi]KYH35328.1 type II secretion system protein G precursor [Clostridium tepidiprofundi DSM 19306]